MCEEAEKSELSEEDVVVDVVEKNNKLEGEEFWRLLFKGLSLARRSNAKSRDYATARHFQPLTMRVAGAGPAKALSHIIGPPRQGFAKFRGSCGYFRFRKLGQAFLLRSRRKTRRPARDLF